MTQSNNKWNDLNIKDKIGYLVAFAMIGSAIILAFLSFFLNAYDIESGVLLYIAQCFLIGGSIVGANVYFKSKWLEYDTKSASKIKEEVEKEIERRIVKND